MKNDRSRCIWVMAVIVGTLVIRVGLLMHYGVAIGGDTMTYLNHADNIISSGLGFYYDHIGTIWYWGYPTFLALIFSVIGQNLFTVALIQTVLISLTCVLLYKLMVYLGCKEILAVMLTLFYSLNFDVNMWDRYILSDCMGMFWECICLFCFYRLFLIKMDENRIDGRWMTLWITSGMIFFSARSNAISLILGMIMILLFSIENKKTRRIYIWGASY